MARNINNASVQKWAKKIEAARSAADDRRLDLRHAVVILEMVGDHIATPGLCPEDLECQELGLRVEYMARVIARHTEDLAKELEKIEVALLAMSRGEEATPASAAANVVHLSQPDGDAA